MKNINNLYRKNDFILHIFFYYIDRFIFLIKIITQKIRLKIIVYAKEKKIP